MSSQIPWNLTEFENIINNLVPQRVLLCVFGFLAVVNVYTMRLSLDVSMLHLVENKKKISARIFQKPQQSFSELTEMLRRNLTLAQITNALKERVLPGAKTIKRIKLKTQSETYNWLPQLQKGILATFHIGYIIGHVPAGQLAQQYGGKWVLGTGILASALLTLLTPLAIQLGGPVALICIRLLIGLSQSSTYPALSALLAKWVPARERGKLGVLVFSGGQVGVVVVNFMAGFLLKSFDWPLIFYLFGCCGLLWVILFAHFCYSDPETHPLIKEPERQYLRHEIKSVCPRSQLPPTPWKAIFSSIPMWAFISATVQNDWCQYASVSEVSKHLQNIEQLPLKESIFASVYISMPYILSWLVSLLSGVLVDILITNGVLTTSGARKIMSSVAAFGPQLFQGFVSCFSCDKQKRQSIFPLLQCAFTVVGTHYAGIKLTALDMSPNYAGTLMGIANCMGAVTGLVAPHLEKLFSPEQCGKLKDFRSFAWMITTALSSGEVQSFNNPNSPNSQAEIKAN